MKRCSEYKKAIYSLDPWQVRETEFDIETNYRDETIFAVGNGYIGMRGNLEEGYTGPENTTFNATYINGFYEEYDIRYPEDGYGFARKGQAMVNVADGKIIKPVIDGEELDLLKGRIHFYERILDMKKGIVERKVTWESPKGRIVEIHIKKLTSFTRPHLAVISFRIKPVNFDGRLEFISRVNGKIFNNVEYGKDFRVGSGIRGRVLKTVERAVDDTVGFIKQKTERSGLSLVCAVDHDITPKKGCFISTAEQEDMIEIKIAVNARRGTCYTLFKYISYFTSRDYQEYDLENLAIKEVTGAKVDGMSIIEEEQEKFLDGFWEDADIIVEGDPVSQQGIRFCMFSLLQSTGRDGKTSIAAKGLTGAGYEGHYFWDSEIYVLPFFVYTRHEIARNLLLYCYRLLDAARGRARELGHRGALFPWRTIDGPECSAYFPAGTAQYHIDADIAFAIKVYEEATEDMEFLYKYGAEILFETARFWADLGAYIPSKGNRFCINCVTGPDEYTALVDNNAYTNYMAKVNMEYAVEVAGMMKRERPGDYEQLVEKIGLKQEEIRAWQKAAEDMYLPYSDELKIIPQDDSFLHRKRIDIDQIPEDQFPLLLHWHYLNIYRHQICKQPDVLLLMMLLRKRFTVEEIKRNYDYYEPITTHDSSLSPSVFSILACDIGYERDAYDYFIQTVRMDLDDYNGNVKHGIHAANMGGAWNAVIYGFAGMKPDSESLNFCPHLPEKWHGLSFKVRYKNRKILVELKRDSAKFTLLEGDSIKLHYFNEEILLMQGLTVTKEVKNVKV